MPGLSQAMRPAPHAAWPPARRSRPSELVLRPDQRARLVLVPRPRETIESISRCAHSWPSIRCEASLLGPRAGSLLRRRSRRQLAETNRHRSGLALLRGTKRASRFRHTRGDVIDRAERTLREVFGLEAFRPGQSEVVAAMLAGRDVLSVAPTGSGKSISYWV